MYNKTVDLSYSGFAFNSHMPDQKRIHYYYIYILHPFNPVSFPSIWLSIYLSTVHSSSTSQHHQFRKLQAPSKMSTSIHPSPPLPHRHRTLYPSPRFPFPSDPHYWLTSPSTIPTDSDSSNTTNPDPLSATRSRSPLSNFRLPSPLCSLSEPIYHTTTTPPEQQTSPSHHFHPSAQPSRFQTPTTTPITPTALTTAPAPSTPANRSSSYHSPTSLSAFTSSSPAASRSYFNSSRDAIPSFSDIASSSSSSSSHTRRRRRHNNSSDSNYTSTMSMEYTYTPSSFRQADEEEEPWMFTVEYWVRRSWFCITGGCGWGRKGEEGYDDEF